MSATASLVTATPAIDATLNKFLVEGTITLAGNYGGAATHGDTLDLSQLGIPANTVPTRVEIFEAPPAGTAPTGYLFIFCPGTTQANGVMAIFDHLTEYTQGSAYSAGLLAATLKFRAEFVAFS